MKSNQSFRWLVLVALAILASTLTAGMASAATFAGSFTLPFATQWGSTTLPAGDYSFKIETAASPYTARIYGKNVNIIVMANAVADYPAPERNELILRSSQGRFVVRALYLADRSLVISYGRRQADQRVLANSAEPVLHRRVYVTGK